MHKHLIRFGCFGTVLGALLALWVASVGRGQVAPPAKGGPPMAKATPAEPPTQQNLGARQFKNELDCWSCHDKSPLANGNANEDGPLTRITQNEFVVWKDQDRHYHAYAALEGRLAQGMSKLLKYDGRSDVRCLSCHTGRCGPDGMQSPQNDVRKAGVSCQACHGPAEDWIESHREPGWHSKYSPQEKFDQFGLYPVHDKVKRAELCLSCHQGNVEQGKLVTHEMYAAGHPPLGSFEMESFLRAMPSHAMPLHKKKPDKQRYLGFEPDQLHAAELVLTSGLVALRNAATMCADTAAKAEADPKRWPEFALYDCAACHHELQTPSWRQQRGYAGAPGRPTLPEWPLALFKVLDDQGSQPLAPVREALDARPFGAPSKVQAAATLVAKTLDGDALRARTKSLGATAADAQRVLVRICDVGLEQPSDFDTARQLAWAFRAIFQELDQRRMMETDPTSRGMLARRSEILQVLNNLSGMLSLDIAAKLQQAADGAESNTASYAAMLKASRCFDPGKFQDQLRALRQLLKAQ